MQLEIMTESLHTVLATELLFAVRGFYANNHDLSAADPSKDQLRWFEVLSNQLTLSDLKVVVVVSTKSASQIVTRLQLKRFQSYASWQQLVNVKIEYRSDFAFKRFEESPSPPSRSHKNDRSLFSLGCARGIIYELHWYLNWKSIPFKPMIHGRHSNQTHWIMTFLWIFNSNNNKSGPKKVQRLNATNQWFEFRHAIDWVHGDRVVGVRTIEKLGKFVCSPPPPPLDLGKPKITIEIPNFCVISSGEPAIKWNCSYH